eukprot:2489799-Prorocentrum_lima.AAC.1
MKERERGSLGGKREGVKGDRKKRPRSTNREIQRIRGQGEGESETPRSKVTHRDGETRRDTSKWN